MKTVNALYNSFKYKKNIKKYEMFMKGESYSRENRRIMYNQRITNGIIVQVGESCRNRRIGIIGESEELCVTIHILLFSDLAIIALDLGCCEDFAGDSGQWPL